jgi:acetoin utilization protein AcuB
MFHLFTLQGKQADLPLENLKHDLRVATVGKKYRARKFIEGREDRVAERHTGTGEAGSPALKAYKESSRLVNEKERVYYASEIMSSPVISIEPEITAADAWIRFGESSVRHMPVLSASGDIIGILSERDLLKQLIIRDGKVEDAVEIKVKDIMSREVIATNPGTDIRRVARAMLEQHIGLMPVVAEDNTLAGVVTRSDILHAIIHLPGLSLWA